MLLVMNGVEGGGGVGGIGFVGGTWVQPFWPTGQGGAVPAAGLTSRLNVCTAGGLAPLVAVNVRM